MNVATITDGFPLPFTDGVLDVIAEHEVYSFLDGFSGYNQIQMHSDDVVMMFRLKTTPTTFQHIIMEIVEEYILAFMQVFLDDFAL